MKDKTQISYILHMTSTTKLIYEKSYLCAEKSEFIRRKDENGYSSQIVVDFDFQALSGIQEN